MSLTQPSRPRSAAWFTSLALVGWSGCSFQSTATGKPGSSDDAGVGPSIDAFVGIDAAPGATCYGPAGWQACFMPPPTGNFTLPKDIDTDGNAPCLAAQPTGWSSPQSPACFVVGDMITVPTMGTDVKGKRPLVLVGHRLITVAGTLDFTGRRGDKSVPPVECQPPSKDPNAQDVGVGGGGAAGGSFMTRGGNGGDGENGVQNGQSSQADAAPPTHLRGGCPGQAGGALKADDAGVIGGGGGSIYLISNGEIVLQKAIDVSGTGADGGDHRAGGSGGGSGGMIVLYSPKITVPGGAMPVLMANGGGGGGGSQGNRAAAGLNPSLMMPLMPANGGGNGGEGYPATGNAPDGTSGDTNGAGGGGGGGGAGYIRSNMPLAAATASPPLTMVP